MNIFRAIKYKPPEEGGFFIPEIVPLALIQEGGINLPREDQ
jgi:hypothetical protein